MRRIPPSNDGPIADDAGVPAGAPAWVTRELIDLTIRVWQPYYKALLTAEDAQDMILSGARLWGALTQGARGQR